MPAAGINLTAIPVGGKTWTVVTPGTVCHSPPCTLSHDGDPPGKKRKTPDGGAEDAVTGAKVFVLPSGSVPINSHITQMVDTIKPLICQLVEEANLVSGWWGNRWNRADDWWHKEKSLSFISFVFQLLEVATTHISNVYHAVSQSLSSFKSVEMDRLIPLNSVPDVHVILEINSSVITATPYYLSISCMLSWDMYYNLSSLQCWYYHFWF